MMMQVFLDAPLAVQIHIVAATEALLLGPVLLYRRRRDRWHKVLGYVWMTNLVIAALSSFLIADIRVIGRFSPIHILSIGALVAVWLAIGHARAGRIAAHRAVLSRLYWWGVVAAAALTMLPGRRFNRALFGVDETLGLWLIAALGVGFSILWLMRRRRPAQALKRP